MAKRFTETTIWDDDWFYELSPEYKLFWFYIKDNCDHAGVWKPKTRAFKAATDVEIDLNKALEYYNLNKTRIRVLKNGYWFIEDFFSFQYTKRYKQLNVNNRVHKSILDIYIIMDIPISSIKGLETIKVENGDVVDAHEFDLNLRSI
jgi:hypothetical protein